MILYLYGGDSYLRTQKLRELVAQYSKKHGRPDTFEVDLEDNPLSWIDLSAFLEQASMFAETKLAIVRESGSVGEKDEKKWIEFLKRELKTDKNFLILIDKKSPKKAFQFLTKDPARAQEFPDLVGATLSAFLKKEIGARDMSMSVDAFRLLVETIGKEVEVGWSTQQYLSKLQLFGKKKEVERREIEQVFSTSSVGELFMLAKGFMYAIDPKTALPALERALHQADSAHVFNLAASLARGNALVAFSEYDIAVKSGKLGYEEALADFVLGGERLNVFT